MCVWTKPRSAGRGLVGRVCGGDGERSAAVLVAWRTFLTGLFATGLFATGFFATGFFAAGFLTTFLTTFLIGFFTTFLTTFFAFEAPPPPNITGDAAMSVARMATAPTLDGSTKPWHLQRGRARLDPVLAASRAVSPPARSPPHHNRTYMHGMGLQHVATIRAGRLQPVAIARQRGRSVRGHESKANEAIEHLGGELIGVGEIPDGEIRFWGINN